MAKRGVCKIKGCSRKHYGRGLCLFHYERLRNGTPLDAPLQTRNTKHDELCSVEGCGRKYYAKNLCMLHYRRLRDGKQLEDHIIEKRLPIGSVKPFGKTGYTKVKTEHGWVWEHRYVMEGYLNRSLLPEETVHHINGVRSDNRLENLELWSSKHPPGQRVEDQISWAEAVLQRYAPKRSMELAFQSILYGLGEDPAREGLRDTPKRAIKALKELTTPKAFNFTTFDAEGTSEMVVQDNIPFQSLCEHHVLAFIGTATVAYIPSTRIVGLSKLARAVEYCSAGLQNQERITCAVADMLEKHLNPLGVGVVLKARHLCMELRGVKAPNVYTTTSTLRGVFMEKPEVRAEFLALARSNHE